jgi:hypothetical protein
VSDTSGDSATDAEADGNRDQKGQYQHLTRQPSNLTVNVTVEAEGRSFAVKIHSKDVEKDLVHKVAREYAIDLPGYWHPRVISGEGDVCRYQEGDVIRLFPATAASLRTVTEPRTARGSVPAIPKAIGGEKPVQKPVKIPKVERDWIGELAARGETQEQDACSFTARL